MPVKYLSVTLSSDQIEPSIPIEEITFSYDKNEFIDNTTGKSCLSELLISYKIYPT